MGSLCLFPFLEYYITFALRLFYLRSRIVLGSRWLFDLVASYIAGFLAQATDFLNDTSANALNYPIPMVNQTQNHQKLHWFMPLTNQSTSSMPASPIAPLLTTAADHC